MLKLFDGARGEAVNFEQERNVLVGATRIGHRHRYRCSWRNIIINWLDNLHIKRGGLSEVDIVGAGIPSSSVVKGYYFRNEGEDYQRITVSFEVSRKPLGRDREAEAAIKLVGLNVHRELTAYL